MAEPAKPWDAAFRRVRCIYQPEFWYPPRTTAAELDEVEQELNFRFPLSYRAFAQEFGLSGNLHVLPHVLSLRQPPGTPQDYWWCSVVNAALYWRGFNREDSFWDDERETGYPLQRLVIFANDESHHYWAFDPLEVTAPDFREYRIYNINRDLYASARWATFAEWLLWIDTHYRFENDIGDPGEPEFDPVFKPDSPFRDATSYTRYSLSSKTPPAADEIALWLAWNNHTARDLACSIREHGHTDAFPILADALQEAGCSNADLLDSCRTGDPDIDGAWVLQVLLGKP